MGRGDLTDAQWALLEPLLPVGAKPGRPVVWSKRHLIDGIRWRVRTGVPWRDLPTRFGPWQTVYGLFRRWQRDGTWARIVKGLQAHADAVGLICWEVSVDSTVCRAHQHAAGARRDGDLQREPPGGISAEPVDHALGRSRGGWTTKIYLACEQGQRPLSVVITAGQRGDSPQFAAVLEAITVPRHGPGRPRTRPVLLWPTENPGGPATGRAGGPVQPLSTAPQHITVATLATRQRCRTGAHNDDHERQRRRGGTCDLACVWEEGVLPDSSHTTMNTSACARVALCLKGKERTGNL
ncbi:IS5 family transposase [Actinomadura nitritigenes]|uniref:IS5 family transposase n=1 Tax=Actinomadura nitritigenes TaxID=134602 RepID=A0ABS3RGJ7_9ACTN|nr:IS5 family transposase [Actinomadura nitritigenes]MBO2445348.1 IS5 family transposase [Actinomadura nitritigenes]